MLMILVCLGKKGQQVGSTSHLTILWKCPIRRLARGICNRHQRFPQLLLFKRHPVP